MVRRAPRVHGRNYHYGPMSAAAGLLFLSVPAVLAVIAVVSLGLLLYVYRVIPRLSGVAPTPEAQGPRVRSEERRVGKECRL